MASSSKITPCVWQRSRACWGQAATRQGLQHSRKRCWFREANPRYKWCNAVTQCWFEQAWGEPSGSLDFQGVGEEAKQPGLDACVIENQLAARDASHQYVGGSQLVIASIVPIGLTVERRAGSSHCSAGRHLTLELVASLWFSRAWHRTCPGFSYVWFQATFFAIVLSCNGGHHSGLVSRH